MPDYNNIHASMILIFIVSFRQFIEANYILSETKSLFKFLLIVKTRIDKYKRGEKIMKTL